MTDGDGGEGSRGASSKEGACACDGEISLEWWRRGSWADSRERPWRSLLRGETGAPIQPDADGRPDDFPEWISGKTGLGEFLGLACRHCQREAPVLSAVYEKYKSKGLVVLGINVPWDKPRLVRTLDVIRLRIMWDGTQVA